MVDSSVTWHSLRYSCANKDGCDREFLLDHIQWFVGGNSKQFFTEIGFILSGTGVRPGNSLR